MRIVTKAGLAGLALTTATGLMVATSGATNAAPATKSSAYGLAIYADGKEEFPPTPYVESTDGTTQSQGGEVPENPVVYGGVAALSAGNDEASVRVANLTVGEALAELPPELTGPVSDLTAACTGLEEAAPGEQLPDVLSELPIGGIEQPTEDEILAFCAELLDEVIPNLAEIQALDVSCNGDSGSVTVAGVKVLGAAVPFAREVPEDTTLLPAESPVNITLNRQTANSDGSYTVDGIVATVGPEGEGEIVLASTTCGEPIAAPAAGGGDPAPPAAPAPTPVEANAPVTG